MGCQTFYLSILFIIQILTGVFLFKLGLEFTKQQKVLKLIKSGLFYYHVENYNETINAFSEVIRQHNSIPKEVKYINIIFSKGYTQFLLKEYDQSIFTIDFALILDPNQIQVLIFKGIIFSQIAQILQIKGQEKDANIIYDKILELDPKYFDSLIQYEIFYKCLEQPNNGLLLNEVALYNEHQCQDFNCQDDNKHTKEQQKQEEEGFSLNLQKFKVLKGINFINQGQYIEALKAFEQAYRLDSINGPFYYNLALCLFNLKKYEYAIYYSDQAVWKKYDTYMVYQLKAQSYYCLSDFQSALSMYKITVKKILVEVDALSQLINRIDLQINGQEQYFKQIQKYDKIIVKLQEDILTCIEVGQIYNANLNIIEMKIQQDKNKISYLDRQAQLLYNMNEFEKQIQIMDQILELDPNNTKIFFNKGLSLYQLKKFEEAIDNMNKVLIIDPNNNFALLIKGVSLYKQRKHFETPQNSDRPIEKKQQEQAEIIQKQMDQSL